MLVLTRRCSQEIVINDNIRITIVAVQGGHVRLGIDAPPSVRVDRKEVRDRLTGKEEAPYLHVSLSSALQGACD
jgi:carbon storage regulator